jgi:hypothetical protein
MHEGLDSLPGNASDSLFILNNNLHQVGTIAVEQVRRNLCDDASRSNLGDGLLVSLATGYRRYRDDI